MKMQDPSSSHDAPKNSTPATMYGNPATSFRGPHHRRAHSELTFRMPDDVDLSSSDPFNASAASLEEIASEDDLFSTYIDVDKLGAGGNGADQSGEAEKSVKPRHRHSNSVDCSSSKGEEGVFGEIMDAKKAMPPDKLAELWNIDPKRAKRCDCRSVCGIKNQSAGFFGCIVVYEFPLVEIMDNLTYFNHDLICVNEKVRSCHKLKYF